MVTALQVAVASAATIERVNVDSFGNEGVAAQPDDAGSGDAAISGDGRFVVFRSHSPNLVAGDTNECDVPDVVGPGTCADIFLRDRHLGSTTRVSVSSTNEQAEPLQSDDDGSFHAAISRNGRVVAFASTARNLVDGDLNNVSDVFVRDLDAGTTERVSVSSVHDEANASSYLPQLNGDGSVIGFLSQATNLSATFVSGNHYQLYIREAGVTELIAVGFGGAPPNSGVAEFALSDDGQVIAFHSISNNLVAGVAGGAAYVHDRAIGSIELVSVSTAAAASLSECQFNSGGLSASGQLVSFRCAAGSGLDAQNAAGVFVRDRQAGTTQRIVSFATSAGGGRTVISGDGRFVAFDTPEPLSGDDGNGTRDIYLHDRTKGTTVRVSLSAEGAEANAVVSAPTLSFSGRFVTFVSEASNLVAGDKNGADDVFLVDRSALASVAVPAVGHPLTGAGLTLITILAISMAWKFHRSDCLQRRRAPPGIAID